MRPLNTIPVRVHCDCRASLHPIRASLSGLTTASRKCRSCGRQYQVNVNVLRNIDGELAVHVAELIELK